MFHDLHLPGQTLLNHDILISLSNTVSMLKLHINKSKHIVRVEHFPVCSVNGDIVANFDC